MDGRVVVSKGRINDPLLTLNLRWLDLEFRTVGKTTDGKRNTSRRKGKNRNSIRGNALP